MSLTRSFSGDRDYSLFGLRVRSSLALPELFPASHGGDPDVIISSGSVPEAETAGPGLGSVDGALLLVIPEVATFKIEAGKRITIAAKADAPESNVRLYLLGSAFGALLHQRGLLPLHANAVEIDGRAVAFMGASGAGKSTLAAWFHDHGHRVIADDVCVIEFKTDGLPFALPGLPRLRLWTEALRLMGREPEGFARSYAGDEQYDKFDVPIDAKSAAQSPTPLAALYLLNRGPGFSIEQLGGIEASEAVFANTYRGHYVLAAGSEQAHWLSSVRLVRSSPVFRTSREWDFACLDDHCRRLLDHAAASVASIDADFGVAR